MAKKKQKKKTKKSLFRRLLNWFLFLVFLGVFGITTFIFSVYSGVFGELPNAKMLEKIENYTASEVYSVDGKLLGRYYIENRTNTAYDAISPHVINALIATEDARFFEHNGIDKISVLRVIFKTILLGDRSSGGGSTLSQQLAKNLYKRNDYSFLSMPVAKVKEAIIASRIEEIYTKEQVLTLYLNTVPFGENIFGVEMAAERYFSTSPKKLTIEEAATIIGMLKAPFTYNPRLHPEKSKQRRNVVLNQMVKNATLDSKKAALLKKKPLDLRYKKLSRQSGLATYFREQVRQYVQKEIEVYNRENGTNYNFYTDGLKIYTSIDSRMQTYAENAMKDHMKNLQKEFDKHWENRNLFKKHPEIISSEAKKTVLYKSLTNKGLSHKEAIAEMKKPKPTNLFSWDGDFTKNISPIDSIAYYQSILHAGFMAMNPKDGAIKAWIGGIDYEYFQYDHVLSKRQVGSTFKPFVYAAAIENGARPCDYISNERVVYEDYQDWSPRNSDNTYEGYYSMQGGLQNSVNTISTKIAMATGLQSVVYQAQKMGITSDMKEVPSIALGTASVSLQEMLEAYTAFPNKGKQNKAHFIYKINTSSGKTIIEYKQDQEEKQVIKESTARYMSHMLAAVVDSGTARSIRNRYNIKGSLAGKTGTTQSQADGWFIGFSPNLVMGAWVGAENPKIHFRSIALGQGAHTALPICASFYQQLERNTTYANDVQELFPELTPEEKEMLDCKPYVKNNPQIFKNLFRKNPDKIKAPDIKEPRRKEEETKEKDGFFNKVKNWFRSKDKKDN